MVICMAILAALLILGGFGLGSDLVGSSGFIVLAVAMATDALLTGIEKAARKLAGPAEHIERMVACLPVDAPTPPPTDRQHEKSPSETPQKGL